MQNHEQKEKVKNQDSMHKTNFFLSTLPFNPWAVLATWELLIKYKKNDLNTIFNKKSPQAHTESEFDVLGVHGKLVKYVVHSSKRINWKNKNKKSSHKLPKQQLSSFWSQGILRVNL
jgi:hypothetical protein